MKISNTTIKRNLKAAGLLVCLSSLISCQTLTVYPEGRAAAKTARLKPDYQKSEPFFLWGLVGDSVVPAGEICKNGEKPVKLQSQTTFADALIPAVLGLAIGAAAFYSYALFSDDWDLFDGGEDDNFAAIVAEAGAEGVISGGLIAVALGLFGYKVGSGIYAPKTAKVWCGKAGEQTPKAPTTAKAWRGKAGEQTPKAPTTAKAWRGKAGEQAPKAPKAAKAWRGKAGEQALKAPKAAKAWRGKAGEQAPRAGAKLLEAI